ncbi:MAG: FHA domain-containing protein [Deltaproteobacteria bacterium]|nr:MAG: FHA domain-containing protein [Deltaproteobacteria bacterium]
MALALVGLSSQAMAAKVSFDYFDDSDWLKEDKGFVRFFVDVLDDNYLVVPKDGIQEVNVYVEDNLVPGDMTIETVKDANEPVAIAILVAAHQSYAYKMEGSASPDILEATKRGYKAFLGNLSDQDWTTVWYYNEEGIKRVQSWGQNQSQAADQLDRIKPGEKGDMQPPGLYNAIKKVVEDVNENSSTLPRRRLVVVMSDGKDRYLENSSLLERRINDIVETATTAGNAKIYALGYTLDLPDPLVNLNTVAQKTGGIYRNVSEVDSEDGIATELEKLSREIKNQYVMTFKPKDFGGSDKPVNFRLEMMTTAGPGKYISANPIKWPAKPFNIMGIIIIVLIVIGSLLGIFLLIKLFKGMAARRANRPVEVEEEEEYVGPYKGKLTCTGGAYAGSEFFLTEDVTTIGAIAGNGIVIQEAGVSKRHAGIKIEDMRFELADFGSTNGTYVNGNKITKQFLRDQDKIRIGECELKFTLK